jgi:hypothetical protein
MRKWFNVVAIALAMVVGSYAVAKDADADGPKPLHGKVTAVAKDTADAKITDITISSHAKVKGDPPVETVLKVDDSTKITKQGADSATLADVVVGSIVSVTMGDSNKVLSIEIRAPKKKAA